MKLVLITIILMLFIISFFKLIYKYKIKKE